MTAPPITALVLVVEDEPLVRADLAEVLRQAGLGVIEATSGDEALTFLRTKADIGLVITDIRMPGQTDGLELARWIRAERPEVKVMLATGNFLTDLGTHVDAIFSKPYSPTNLAKRAIELMRAEQPADAAEGSIPDRAPDGV